MARVANFLVIEGDTDVVVGEGNPNRDHVRNFSTPDYVTNGRAYLMLMVEGLQEATARANVLINNVDVGGIFPNHSSAPGDRETQVINIGSGVLNTGANTMEVQAVGFPGSGGANVFDDFQLRDVVLCYQVEV